ncbi:hypothetical protein RHM66_02455 [Pseudomonas sp. RTB3]|nr:hypothetical protein RHM66_02455 [Pseudomonas sp. RTB3]
MSVAVAWKSLWAARQQFSAGGEDGAEILKLALKTERLYLDFDAQLPLNAGATRVAHFNWAVQSDGSHRPQWRAGLP